MQLEHQSYNVTGFLIAVLMEKYLLNVMRQLQIQYIISEDLLEMLLIVKFPIVRQYVMFLLTVTVHPIHRFTQAYLRE